MVNRFLNVVSNLISVIPAVLQNIIYVACNLQRMQRDQKGDRLSFATAPKII
jgi:hypothetical protein